ncbi:unnamed protein product [Rotaria socialis]|uniref:DUF1868 domain-containing protein n=2 Tax=Rotaria socialis TaxID=392032 RepID=A0A818IE27_9BILA|nr:unnamed protein product [Rotaria socialis]
MTMGNTNTGVQLYRKKIDSTGNYLPFPGYTIIAHATHPLPKPLVELVSYLSSSELRKYYSFLPTTSYHVTINPLEGVHDEHKELLEQEQGRLKQQDTSLVGTAQNLLCSTIILIEVQLNDSNNPNFEQIIQYVRSTNLQQANILRNYTQSWHLTLAYPYKDIENNEIKERLYKIIENMPESAKLPFMIPLEHIRICRYNDMTRFTSI